MMTPYKTKLLLGIFCTLSLFPTSLFSDVKRYESGLGRDWEFVNSIGESQTRPTESQQISEFFKENFSATHRDGEWREWKEVKDLSHHHHHYHYFYKDRRVDGLGLDLHYNLKGWVQYASSDLEKYLNLDFEADSAEIRERVAGKLYLKLRNQMKRPFKSWKWEPILWKKDSASEFLPAYEIQVIYDNPFQVKNLIVEQTTGDILVDYKKVRYAGDPARVVIPVKVYRNSIADNPDNPPSQTDPYNPANLASVSITTDSDSTLKSSELHVYREEVNNGTESLQEITPADYSGSASFKTHPANFNSICFSNDTSSATPCANQAFDGVNIFYHLSEYRTQIVPRNISVTLPDPLTVIVNYIPGSWARLKFDNAAYIPQPCWIVGAETIPRCLTFWRPTGTYNCSGLGCPYPNCSNSVVIDNLAREAFVVAHEYQHYITDQLSGLEFADHYPKSVGDALHEGYSDYGAATYLTKTLGKDTTLGLISFPVCVDARRDLKDLRVFQDTYENSDEHMAGLTWASSLWKIRKTLGSSGPAIVDALMFKSMSFLGSNPGFVSSVEALVKADRELNGGANIALIRQVLYSEAKFTGSETAPFKDPLTAEANVGFRGCGGVFNRFSEERSRVPAIAFLLWGILSIILGRFLSKRTST
jgi:hypothetical protein